MDFGFIHFLGWQDDRTGALPATYDPALVLLSFGVACLAGYAFLALAGRLGDLGEGAVRRIWIVAGGAALGIGVWAMHFVAMLAYRLPVSLGYDLATTLFSLVPAMLAGMIALHVVGRRVVTTRRIVVGGLLVGTGIGAMHYTGMAAIRFDAAMRYDPTTFLVSVAVAVLLSILALHVRFWAQRGTDGVEQTLREATGAVVLGLAIAGMHYTAMQSSFCFPSAAGAGLANGLIDPAALGIGTGIATVGILLTAIVVVVLDRRLGREIGRREAAAARAAVADARLMAAVEAMPEAFALFDSQERLVAFNARYRALNAATIPDFGVGTAAAEIVASLGQSGMVDLGGAAPEDWIETRLAAFRNLGEPHAQRRADGRWLLINQRRTADGGTIIVQTDITALKEAEQRLKQADRLQAVGQLTGGIAHDFNNLLTVIIGNLEVMEMGIGRAPREWRDPLKLAIRAADRGAELTRRLLAFSRRQVLEPETVDANALVGQLSEMLRRTLGASVELETHCAPALWQARVDPSQLENAILNLAINARDAMPQGGRLTVQTANVELDAAAIGRDEDLLPGAYVTVAVSDTGTGMSRETQQRAFEPFFTTKDVGKGTGLGLSMVYGFAKQSGGHVRIYSEWGAGTTVRLYLPRAATAAAAVAESAAPTSAAPGGTETILVAEDDADVRTTVVSALKCLGYRIIEAENGVNALTALDRDPHVDLLFTDIVMPGGMTDVELARAARARRPGIKTVYTSGHPEQAVLRAGMVTPDMVVVPKPCTRDNLARRVRQALDA